jgi:hypothetical protein
MLRDSYADELPRLRCCILLDSMAKVIMQFEMNEQYIKVLREFAEYYNCYSTEKINMKFISLLTKLNLRLGVFKYKMIIS